MNILTVREFSYELEQLRENSCRWPSVREAGTVDFAIYQEPEIRLKTWSRKPEKVKEYRFVNLVDTQNV